MAEGHHEEGISPVTAKAAQDIARLMGGLATSSRVRILACLRDNPSTVGELTSAIAMEQPAVSHQLRILRDLSFVVGVRRGRHVVYDLYDSHVAALIDEVLRHMDHVQADVSEVQVLPTVDQDISTKESP